MLVGMDRDGVVAICPPGKYNLTAEDLTLYENAALAIVLLQGIGAQVCIITNQPAIGNGDISVAEYQRMHLKIQAAIAEKGGKPIHIFTCPHQKCEVFTQYKCSCRKPQPGLLFTAAGWLHESPFNMTFIGDYWTDIAAVKAIGENTRAIMLHTGRGELQENEDKFHELDISPDSYSYTLLGAAEYIIKEEAKTGNVLAGFDSSLIARAKDTREINTPTMGG